MTVTQDTTLIQNISARINLHLLYLVCLTPNLFDPLTAKLINLNFHPLEIVSR